MNKDQLKDLIERTLKETNMYKPEAVDLLLGTTAQESHMGEYICQLGNGPALGIFQMEPNTFKDILLNYLKYKPSLAGKIIKAANVDRFKVRDLEYNLVIQICFARIQYLRRPEKLPVTLDGMAKYWKQWYNTPLGKGTTKEFIDNFKKFVQ